MTRSRALAGPFLLLAALACRPETGTVPLLDGQHTPDVLVESRRLERPPALDGNRFLRGWRPGRGDVLATDGSADGDRLRLELVSLVDRPRTVVLEGELGAPPVEASIAGQTIRVTPAGDRVELEVPAGLPPGRLAVDLRLAPSAVWRIGAGGVRPTLPAGAVEVAEGALIQSGWSRVDVVRPLAAEARLEGRFVPPAAPEPDQRFAIEVESEGRPARRVFEWTGGWLDRLRGERSLSVPLETAGFVRLRFVAEGEGAAARWEGLALRGAAPSPEAEAAATAPPPPPRLVLLHVFDALRADHVSHLGGPADLTPIVDRVAAEGVVFTRHASVAPNTLPSTLALFGGRTVRTKRGLSIRGPDTLAAAIRERGVLTAAFSENGNVSPALRMTQGFDHVETASMMEADKRLHWPAVPLYNYSSERGHRAARKWLDGLDAKSRAFVYVHVVNPHNPFAPPRPLEERFVREEGSTIDGSTTTLLAINRERRPVSAADRARIRELYTASVAYADFEFGRFAAALVKRFRPGEVLLILTADHGDELFDHDGLLHGYTLYEDQLHIPLVFWWPGVLPPARIEAATDHLDLHATLRALFAAPPIAGDGRSLWPLLLGRSREGKSIRLAAAPNVAGGIFMARSDRYKLIWAPQAGNRWGQGVRLGRSRDPEYVFDLAADRGEKVNLAGDGLLEVAWLRERLRAWVDEGRNAEAAAKAEKIKVDAETLKQLRALGYANP